MSAHLELVPLAGFAGLMLTAGYEDFRRFIIPNQLTGALCLLWPLYALTLPSLAVALTSIGCALCVFLIGALLFSRGYMGGGDVKLLAAAALWAGAAGTPELVATTGILGGVLALILLTPPGAYLMTAARALAAPQARGSNSLEATPSGADQNGRPRIPYGIAIAAASLLVVIPPFLD